MSTRPPRPLVLCFDGTLGEYSHKNTNVVKFHALLEKENVNEQICYYQPGIGTFFQPGIIRPFLKAAAAILDAAVAWYLSEHVLDGYRFLMQNYNVGDKVCLFGFSRGAYTARALAGMLKKVGLLSKDNFVQVPFAYKIYSSSRASDQSLAPSFKEKFSRDIPIEFVGVWDTVANVGIIMAKTLPFVSTNCNIKTFRQALSLDEHRVRFNPNLYQMDGEGELMEIDNDSTTDAREVWFVGDHEDVGGGRLLDSVESSLSQIGLRWMVYQVLLADCGIIFDDAARAREGISPIPKVKIDGVAEKNDGGDSRDAKDAMQRVHCDLRRYPLWWILEFLPTTYNAQNTANTIFSYLGFHMGRGRNVPPNPEFHTIVKVRMENSRYSPKARYEKGTETYVS